MGETKPGADEIRIRNLLRTKGIGPDAPPPVIPPKPTARPRDWLDTILDSPPTPAAPEPVAEPEPAAPEPPEPAPKAPPSKPKKRPKKKRKPSPCAAVDHPPQDPRQSLLDAYDRIPPRLKWLAYRATAAAAGWRIGLVDWSTDTTAWFAAGHWVTTSAWALYGLAVCAIALYRRTRPAMWLIAWAASIPVSSVVVGVLLYGTGYHP